MPDRRQIRRDPPPELTVHEMVRIDVGMDSVSRGIWWHMGEGSGVIPMAMLMSVLVMSALGVGLDQMSLAALIIALGMLVDNAIVMS